MTQPTPEPRRYVVREYQSMTLNEAYRIKASTGVDVYDPPTALHRLAALIWFASLSTEDPLKWKDLQDLDSDAIGELVHLPEDDEPDTNQVDPGPEASVGPEDPDAPKDLTTSTSSPSPAGGAVPPPPPPSASAPSPS